MNLLMQVSLFSEEFIALSEFYRDVFDLPEVEDLRSDVFRGYLSGEVMVGFSALAAYEMLGLDQRMPGEHDQTAFTFRCDTKEALDACLEKALARGGTLVQEQFMTYYNWYMAVLRDPDGNAIRLACTTP
ncbi:VOC family protein [Celeribacter sp. SCSIO 80788]|uniref:VOC family protein n=1 Tax=Celeribacter sp. SCSIO 80788 TaxID=3117013 RepID=UPI003DA6C956